MTKERAQEIHDELFDMYPRPDEEGRLLDAAETILGAFKRIEELQVALQAERERFDHLCNAHEELRSCAINYQRRGVNEWRARIDDELAQAAKKSTAQKLAEATGIR